MPRRIDWNVVRPLVEQVMRGELSDADGAARLRVTLRSFRGYLPVVAAMKRGEITTGTGAPVGLTPKPSLTPSAQPSGGSSAPPSSSPATPSENPASVSPVGTSGQAPAVSTQPATATPQAGPEPQAPKKSSGSTSRPNRSTFAGGLRGKQSTSGPATTKSQPKKRDILDDILG
jgi:hypothetical protein